MDVHNLVESDAFIILSHQVEVWTVWAEVRFYEVLPKFDKGPIFVDILGGYFEKYFGIFVF